MRHGALSLGGVSTWRRAYQRRFGVSAAAQHARPPLLLVLLLLSLVAAGEAPGKLAVRARPRPGNVHTLILTDCAKYQDWQSIAGAFAWRESGQAGAVTRIATCNPADTLKYSKAMLQVVDTHMAPEYAYNEELRDWYAAYNKPGALIDWLAKTDVKEEWLLLLDADMLLRRTFDPDAFRAAGMKLERGWALGAHYDYLKGVHNDLATRNAPLIVPRNDSLTGPVGRRGDKVGAPYFMHRDDLKKVAPLWLNFTKIVRNDSEAWRDSGDTAAKAGDRIWIAEMYGYCFGAASADVWHTWGPEFMLYPGYTPGSIPYTIHYGLTYTLGDWQFDKHWFFDFDAAKCPPWDMTTDRPKSGIFPPPPHPSTLPQKDFLGRYTDLLGIQTMSLINAALCEHHLLNCPASEQLRDVCTKAIQLYLDTKEEVLDAEWNWDCIDHNKDCKMWSERKECDKSLEYMKEHCRVSCGWCTPKGPRPKSGSSSAALLAAGAGGAGPGAEAGKDGGGGEGTGAQPSPAGVSPLPAALGATNAELKAKFPASTKTYAELVHRCTLLEALSEQQLKLCLSAAALQLEFPGTVVKGAKVRALREPQAGGAAATAAGGGAGGAGGGERGIHPLVDAAGQRGGVGGVALGEALGVLALVVAAAVFACVTIRRRRAAKPHRRE